MQGADLKARRKLKEIKTMKNKYTIGDKVMYKGVVYEVVDFRVLDKMYGGLVYDIAECDGDGEMLDVREIDITPFPIDNGTKAEEGTIQKIKEIILTFYELDEQGNPTIPTSDDVGQIDPEEYATEAIAQIWKRISKDEA